MFVLFDFQERCDMARVFPFISATESQEAESGTIGRCLM